MFINNKKWKKSNKPTTYIITNDFCFPLFSIHFPIMCIFLSTHYIIHFLKKWNLKNPPKTKKSSHSQLLTYKCLNGKVIYIFQHCCVKSVTIWAKRVEKRLLLVVANSLWEKFESFRRIPKDFFRENFSQREFFRENVSKRVFSERIFLERAILERAFSERTFLERYLRKFFLR